MTSIRLPAPRDPVVPGWLLAVLIVIGTEVMFFAALVSGHLVGRASGTAAVPWQLQLPYGQTLLNMAALLASAVTMRHAIQRVHLPRVSARWIGVTMGLGAAFVALQGMEWARLLHYGLTTHSGLYGAYFYLIVGAHGLHVVAGLLLLAAARFGNRREAFARGTATFWYFVVALWPVLWLIVYPRAA